MAGLPGSPSFSALVWATLAFAVVVLVHGPAYRLAVQPVDRHRSPAYWASGKALWIGIVVRTWAGVLVSVEQIFVYLLIYWARTGNGIGFNGVAVAALFFNLPILWMAISTISAAFDTLTTSVGGGQRGQIERATGTAVRAVSGGVAALDAAQSAGGARQRRAGGWTEGGSPARAAYDPDKAFTGPPPARGRAAVPNTRAQAAAERAKGGSKSDPARARSTVPPPPTEDAPPHTDADWSRSGPDATDTTSLAGRGRAASSAEEPPDDGAPHAAEQAGIAAYAPAFLYAETADQQHPTGVLAAPPPDDDAPPHTDADWIPDAPEAAPDAPTVFNARTEALGPPPAAVADGLAGVGTYLAEGGMAAIQSRPQDGSRPVDKPPAKPQTPAPRARPAPPPGRLL